VDDEESMKVKAHYYVEVTIDFPGQYPDDLTETKEWIQKEYGMLKIPAIKNLLGGNRAILVGEIPPMKNTVRRGEPKFVVPPL